MSAKATKLSASCQQIVTQDLNDLSKSKLVIRSCMVDADLAPTITNHKCNGVILTPSGLYADMAVTVARYIWRHHRGQDAELPGFNVCDLEVHKPFIIKDPSKVEDYWLEMETTTSLPTGTRDDIFQAILQCTFHTISPAGVRIQQNGHCSVRFEWYYGWLSDWSNLTSTIKNRIDKLYTRANKESNAEVQLVQRSKAYELFESFVQYTGKYQNMSEVVFDSTTLEATALLSFLPDPATDLVGPYYIDGSCHLSGFVCNAVEKDKDKNAYISHGVGSMKLSPMFRPEKTDSEMRSYVRMQPLPKDETVLQGDVYVLQDGEVVGVWEGVRFKRIPRRVLNVFLPPPRLL